MIERSLKFAGMLVVVLFGAWAGTRTYLAHRAAPTDEPLVRVAAGEASPPSKSDAAVESASGVLPPARVPARLPAFSLAGLDGRPTPIDRWHGRAIVLNFWATWCAPCRREIPLLTRVSHDWAQRGVSVVGVAVDHPEAVARFVGELHVDYPVLTGEQDALDVAKALGVDTPVFPFTVFVDRGGDVVALYLGELHAAEIDLLLGEVTRVDRDEESLEQARAHIDAGLAKLASAPAHP